MSEPKPLPPPMDASSLAAVAERDRRYAELTAQGWGCTEIAEQIGVAPATVRAGLKRWHETTGAVESEDPKTRRAMIDLKLDACEQRCWNILRTDPDARYAVQILNTLLRIQSQRVTLHGLSATSESDDAKSAVTTLSTQELVQRASLFFGAIRDAVGGVETSGSGERRGVARNVHPLPEPAVNDDAVVSP